MIVLIYGSRGWIGSQFIELLKQQNISFVEAKSRAEDYENCEKEILSLNVSHVVSFIGRTHGPGFSTIDYLEQPGKLTENLNDNLYAPIILCNICLKHKIHYTYMGTGCIFEYDTEHPYGEEINGFTENNEPNFFGSSYSIVKGYTDKLMHVYPVLNLRIRMPISGEDCPRNFISKIIRYKKICNIPNSMTVLPDMLPIIVDMMQKGVTGTFNMTNPGLISHNTVLEMYKKYIDSSFNWENFTQEEQDRVLLSKRSNNFLDTRKLETMYPSINRIEVSVEHILKNWNKKLSN
jgi:dTDP-4-dehydrorhamnose reductase